ncbi:MAG TPA: YlaI family protein [Candidatus Angelobacter sp.]|nr:YlaI family protein [Candidatus Angelobacter sp.]
MKITCVLCQKKDDIDDQALIAKRLKNRPIHTYMCDSCHDRITEKTLQRLETGQFRIYHKEVQNKEQW